MKKITLTIILLPAFVFGQVKVPERGFISSTPAETWEQGLISGNGTIGANVFCHPLDETIIFTHERLFLPMGPPTMPPDQSARLFEIRQLIDRGLYKQATQLQFALSGQESFMYPDPFVPAFDLGIRMNNSGEIRDYLRSVNFETGEASVNWSDAVGSYDRKLFVSRADGIVVMRIRGSKAGILNCELKLKRRVPSSKLDYKYVQGSISRAATHISDVKIAADGSVLSYRNGFTHAYPGSVQALEGLAWVEVKGGETRINSETMVVSGADEILILLDIRLLYDPDKSQMEAMRSALSGINRDYQDLLERHARIHGALFSRMRLDLGGGADHLLPTEKLFELSTNDHLNSALIEKEFDAGRYNIISCTGELPPNLQGVWAGTYVPDWASDYTHNGNVPSAIASLLMGNTPELMLAYTSYIESIVPWMEINARHLFGARGVVLPSRSTTNGYNNALAGTFAGGFWVGGAAWAAHFFYDYYLYTGDKQFLAGHALPFMEKCGLFFEDYLYEGPDGKFIFSPTQSPENTPGNTNSQGSFNATMDVAAAKELFNNLIAASQELGANREKIPVWKSMLSKMPDYAIDSNGMIKEWLTPLLENNDAHRHSSQLYALYDGLPDEIANHPELKRAFLKSIEYKLDRHWRNQPLGFMSFGLVQLGQAGASLGDGKIVYECLKHLVNRFWLSNLASMHNHKSLFNMDISGGMPAVIIKMLAASEPGKITLLPALPPAWPRGEIQGVLCRGQITLSSLQWDQGKVKATLVSGKDQTIVIEALGRSQKVRLTAGKPATIEFNP
ncbi:MAG: glycoside hydrolase N-terminal domain-containing protein [Bacteroidales bacterium]